MSATARTTALTLALVVAAMACALTNPEIPPEAPGVTVAGVSGQCLSTSCMAWTPDSKTLYVVANLAAPLGGSLMAVDPSSATSVRKWSIDILAGGLLMSPDGAALFFSTPTDSTRTQFSIHRMTLASGVDVTVTTASATDILVSPDGTALAYHAVARTSTADTVVVLDLVSGARRTTTVLDLCLLRAFSGDGTRVAMNTALTDPTPIQIWNVTTGARNVVVTPAWSKYLRDLRWSGNDFRALYNSTGDASAVLRDTALSGGTAITYAAGSTGASLRWRPDQPNPGVFMAMQSTLCGREDCSIVRYEFVYATTSTAVTLGSAIRGYLWQFLASPDGHYLAHVEQAGSLSLLFQQTP